MPSTAQRRVIDPILSNVVLGYRHPEHIGFELFPRVPVLVSAGKIIKFGKDAFRLYNTARAPGATTKRVQFGYADGNYGLENHALDAQVPIEHQRDAERVPGINLATGAVNGVMRVNSLILEKAQADLARDATKYDANHKITLSGTAQWNDQANSDPVAVINVGREAVRSSIGMYPNKLEISAAVFNALCEHPKILDKIKHTQIGVVTEELLARVFKVDKVVVGKAIGFDDADATIDIWGKDAILAYVPGVATTMEEPSFGYTYTMLGHPNVEQPWYEKSTKSWIYGVGYERAPLLTGVTAAYLIQNAIA